MIPDSITVRSIREGRIEEGKHEIFARHLGTYPLYRRLVIKMILAADRISRRR